MRIGTKIFLLLIFSVILVFAGCQLSEKASTNGSLSEEELQEKGKSKQVIILAYHHLTEDEPQSGAELEVEKFKEQMEFLHENNYNTLSLKELWEYHEKGYFPANSIVITFDDGYRSFYTKAYPVLEKYGFNASVFPIVSLTPGLERKELWIDHLSFSDMREMNSELICFGSHTYDLHYYTEEDRPAIKQKGDENEEAYKERIEKDLSLSKDLLELQTDQEIFSLAWPYGVETDTARQIALDLEYKLLFTIVEKPFSAEMSLQEIPRFSITDETLEEFEKLLKEASKL